MKARLTIPWRCLLVLAAQVVLYVALPATAGAASKETRLEAAFLYNFVKYVDWPEAAFGSSTAPVLICIVGDADLLSVLQESIAGKSVRERAIDVVGASAGEDRATLGRCHVLFVSSSQPGGASRLNRALKGKPVLTVSDDEKFVHDGGVVSFRRDGPHLRIDLNAGEARTRGLAISAQLLQVANLVSADD